MDMTVLLADLDEVRFTAEDAVQQHAASERDDWASPHKRDLTPHVPVFVPRGPIVGLKKATRCRQHMVGGAVVDLRRGARMARDGQRPWNRTGARRLERHGDHAGRRERDSANGSRS